MKEKLLNPHPEKKANPRESGALFLAIGFAALLTMGVLGYLKLSDDNKVDREVSVVQKSVSSTQEIMQTKIQEKLPAQKEKMIIPKKADIQGKWFTTFGKSSVAEIDITGENFELVFTEDPQGRLRKFSKGTYKYNEKSGKLTLSPSKGAGVPRPIPGVHYEVLTMRSFDVFVSKRLEDHDLYFIAPEYQIISKSFHPLFLLADYAGAPVLKFTPLHVKGK